MLHWIVSELNRRGVLKGAGAYLVGGFGLLQAADLALPRLGAPDWMVTALLVALLAGFPLVCALAWHYDLGPRGLQRTLLESSPAPRPGSRVVLLLAGVVTLALLGAGGFALLGSREAEAPLRSDWLAIAPFRATGEAAYLEEGMLDLLAAKLTGEGGLRAVEPRALLAVWRQHSDAGAADGRDVARALGAGRVLLGSAVATGPRLVLAGRVLDTGTGNLLASFEATGAADGLPELVDEFAGGLLAQLAGYDRERLRTLEQTPFLAIRAYLEGQRLLRAGRFVEAKTAFAEAQQVDSTFALPGVFHGIAASFTAQWSEAGANLAWRHRASLAPRDRLLLDAFLGSDDGKARTIPDQLALLERLTDTSPDRAEAWYLRADHVYHSDLGSPLPDRLTRAAVFFSSATALDEHFGPADIHLLEIALLRGDTAAARRHGTSFLDFSQEGDLAVYTRWFMDRLDGKAAPVWGRDEPFIIMRMFAGAMAAQLAVGLDASDAAIEWGLSRASNADQFMVDEAALYMLNRGRPARADSIHTQQLLSASVSGPVARLYRALYWETGEDLATLEPVARRLLEGARTDHSTDGAGSHTAACVAAQFLTRAGDDAAALELMRRLQQASDSTNAPNAVGVCHALLHVSRGADAATLAPAVARLDSLLAAGNIGDAWLRDASSLVLAAGYERLGDLERALDATRRRTVGMPGARFMSTQLREEGRLAAALGRHDESRRAYEHYLALRASPERDVAPLVERVREEMNHVRAGIN
jgi:tetratricopeptide (TPR) repeat protein